jgi:ABC-type spermidine/putrescine transport system permease subunit II
MVNTMITRWEWMFLLSASLLYAAIELHERHSFLTIVAVTSHVAVLYAWIYDTIQVKLDRLERRLEDAKRQEGAG